MAAGVENFEPVVRFLMEGIEIPFPIRTVHMKIHMSDENLL